MSLPMTTVSFTSFAAAMAAFTSPAEVRAPPLEDEPLAALLAVVVAPEDVPALPLVLALALVLAAPELPDVDLVTDTGLRTAVDAPAAVAPGAAEGCERAARGTRGTRQ